MRTITVSQPDRWTDTRETLLTCRRTDITAGYRAQVALYAAYGSNLDPDQMRERCPHSPVESVGWLKGWRLTFAGEDVGWDGALVTLVQEPNAQTYVMLYDVSPLDEKVLDEWEGAGLSGAGLYDKLRVRVSTLEGDKLAWTYVLVAYEGGLPSCHHLGLIADAAEKGGAPADYVAEIRNRECSGSAPSD
jgi:AIG2 family protein